jgi:2-hydroxy-3-keto-5-methylthiopentenyl-1-phosphate phosphatase
MKLVLDWDGTVTKRDSVSLVMERFGDFAVYRRTGAQMGASLTHDEALALSFSTVRAPLADVVAWLLANVRLRPGFHELARRYRPLIVSSGFHELIGPILRRERVELPVLANRVTPAPDGWRIEFRERRICRDCGEPCKRVSLPPGEVVYAGDGYSDRCAALAATRVFATGALAAYLAAQNVTYEPFEDLRDVSAALDRGAQP